MKTLLLILSCSIVVIAGSLSLHAQCFCYPHDRIINLDSTFFVDTCLVPNDVPCNETLYTQKQEKYQRGLYTKRYKILFDTLNYILLPALPADSLVLVTWQQIDTMFPATRAGFAALEQRFGSFKLRKRFPEDTNLSDYG